MTRPFLSVVIPTIGRPTLADTLASIVRQSRSELLEPLVIIDTENGDRRAAEKMATEVEIQWCHYGSAPLWGHPQRNHGIQHATGEYLAFLQDDDIWTADALDTIIAALLERPFLHHLFQVDTWQAGIVPRGGLPLPHTMGGNLDVDGIVIPNTPGRLGEFTNDYAGDFYFFRRTLQMCGDPEYVVAGKVIAIGRPTEAEIWWRQPVRQGY